MEFISFKDYSLPLFLALKYIWVNEMVVRGYHSLVVVSVLMPLLGKIKSWQAYMSPQIWV